MLRTLLVFTLAIAVCQSAEPLLIHEWGTFTSLQDERGRTIGGINTDEEALPPFVHDVHPGALYPHRDLSPVFVKAFVAGSPDVTMRLETPVIYIHLPAGQQSATVDLSVAFSGGVLSQFYPKAAVQVNGLAIKKGIKWSPPSLTTSTTSSLTWKNIQVGTPQDGPETDSHVWLAPRQTNAARLTVGDEHERYLFYRGLAHLDAPLVFSRSADGQNFHLAIRHPELKTLPTIWLADLSGKGQAAFRRLDSADINAKPQFSALFSDGDYSSQRLAELKQELHAALVNDGLFPDEASAMLATWEASYFNAAGLRAFFLVPQTWTDKQLPLTVSQPSTIRRVMMGRIELVTPQQRNFIRTIAANPISKTDWLYQIYTKHIYYPKATADEKELKFRPGGEVLLKQLDSPYNQGFFQQHNMEVSNDYRAYLSLGRFRDALLLDAWKREHSVHLGEFIRRYINPFLKLPAQE
jgi:hypothetical protein